MNGISKSIVLSRVKGMLFARGGEGQAHALHRHGSCVRLVKAENDSVGIKIAKSGRKADGHTREVSVQHRFGVHAQNTAVRAAHSDPYAIGVVIEDTVENKVYYVTGDTLYNSRIFDSLPDTGRNIDVLFLPINGVGNNMNMADAARFAKKTHAMTVVPLHFGMFDSLDPKDFPCRNKVIPTIWEEIEV